MADNLYDYEQQNSEETIINPIDIEITDYSELDNEVKVVIIAGLALTQSKILNLINSLGEGSIAQVNGGVTNADGETLSNPASAIGKSATALGVRTEAVGDAAIAGGYNAKAYTKGDVAFNLGAAGIKDEDEFKSIYSDGYNLNGEILDYQGFKLRVTNGAFACAGGVAKGDRAFSTGLQDANTGSWAPRSATFGEKTKTTVKAKNALAGGTSVIVSNYSSIAWGKNLVALERDFVTAIFGQFNKSWHDDEGEPDYKTILEIGNGTSDLAKSNAFLITDDSRAKVFGAPRYANDVYRLGDLNTLVNNELRTTNKTILGAINELKDNAIKDIQWNDKSILNTSTGIAKFNLNAANGTSGTKSLVVNNGRAQADYAFSAGYQPEGQGSLGKFSTTLGQSCRTTVDAGSSLAGGVSTVIFGPNGIAYGRSIVSPNRKITLENGAEIDIATATFGQFNQSYHPTYKTILEIGNGINDSNKSNAFEVLWDGRAKVKSPPAEKDDVVRLGDLDNISSNLDIQINGTSIVKDGVANIVSEELLGDVSTALDEIIALQEAYIGTTFDELHEYAQDLINGGES